MLLDVWIIEATYKGIAHHVFTVVYRDVTSTLTSFGLVVVAYTRLAPEAGSIRAHRFISLLMDTLEVHPCNHEIFWTNGHGLYKRQDIRFSFTNECSVCSVEISADGVVACLKQLKHYISTIDSCGCLIGLPAVLKIEPVFSGALCRYSWPVYLFSCRVLVLSGSRSCGRVSSPGVKLDEGCESLCIEFCVEGDGTSWSCTRSLRHL